MQIIRDINNLPANLLGGAVSIGNFDGVHLGHARIIGQLKKLATEITAPVIIFTFDPHPVRLLRPDQVPPPLTWTKRKAQLLRRLEVDAMVVFPTNEQILSLSPQQFFDQIVCGRLQTRAMAEGPNFFFGHQRTGNIDTLRSLCKAKQIPLKVVDPVRDADDFISSSRIRKAIQAGDVDTARRLLTEPYRIRGMVTHGASRGSKIGFPTANLDAIDTLVPATGVYAGRAIYQGQNFAAAIHVGPNPTFGDDEKKVEAHILDFSENIYGDPLEVDFLTRLRDIQPFDGVESLEKQLTLDVARARQFVGELKSES